VNLQYNGEERIPASRSAVWAFITDPHRISKCLPEVVDVTVHDDRHFDASVQVGIGPVRGKFKLKFALVPDSDQRHLDMKVSGGGFGSTVDLTAGADIDEPEEGTTILKWTGQAVARGPVATVGGRVLDAQAQKLISQAFACVRRSLTASTT
jgi:carbon monoxide dehydrogenase subunit G